MAKPRKGKAKVKVTASGKRVSYGQAGQAKGGGPRVKPGTSYLLVKETILIHQIIYLVRDGSVLEKNLKNKL